MTTNLTRTYQLGLVAAGLTTLAGLVEVVTGSNSWTGGKSAPTTLGIFTIVLAAIMVAAAVLSPRALTSGASLAIAGGITVPALITLTTAGRLAIPGAIAAIAAGGFAVADATQRGSVRRSVSNAWPTLLSAVLAAIYLAFGTVAGPIGILGIAGAMAATTALAIKHRSRSLAAAVLVVGVIPFAAAAWWSVVIPLTAVLLLAIGVPQLLANRLPAPTPRS